MNISFIISMMLLMGAPLFMYTKRDMLLEKSIPVFNIGLIVLLYLSAYVGILQVGFWLVVSIQFLLFLYAICAMCRRRQVINFLREPVTILGVSVAAVLVYGNCGKLAAIWDEFSHWMDTVKAMAYLNDFCTSPVSHCEFRAYSPAMSLFQYYFQKIHFFVDHTIVFNEWQMYFAYQIFLLSLFLPFLLTLGKKNRFAKYFIDILVMIFLLLTFYNRLFGSITIDPAIATLFGCGVAAVLLHERYDTWYLAYITGICALLPITKDAGLYFGTFLALIFLIDVVIGRKAILEMGVNKRMLLGGHLHHLLLCW